MSNKTFYLHSSFATKDYNSSDSSLKVAGYANTTSKDRAGDIVTAEAWANGVENFRQNPILLYQHKHDCPIGKVEKIIVDKKGIYVEASISSVAEKHYGVQTLIREGSLKSFSVGFSVKKGRYNSAEDTTMITEVELMEISVVSVPANRESLFSVKKSFETTEEYKSFIEDITTEKTPESEILEKSENSIPLIITENALSTDDEDHSEDPNEKIPFINLLDKSETIVDTTNIDKETISTKTNLQEEQNPITEILEIDDTSNCCENNILMAVEPAKEIIKTISEDSTINTNVENELLHNDSTKENEMAEQVVETIALGDIAKSTEADTKSNVATATVAAPRVAALVEKAGEAIIKEGDAKDKFGEYTPKETNELQELQSQLAQYRSQIKAMQNQKLEFADNHRTSATFSAKEMADAAILAKAMNKSDVYATKFGSRMKAVTTVDQFLSNYSSNIYAEMEQKLVIAPMFRKIQVDAKNFDVPVTSEDTDGDVAMFKSGTFATGVGDTTNVPTSNQNTISSVRFSPNKFMATTHLAKDEEEDTILALMDFLRESATRRLARAIDKSILRGTGGLTGFTASPTNTITPGTGYASVIEGITNLTADASLTTGTGSASDKVDPTDIAAARAMMGKYGLQLGSDLVFLTSIEGYNNLVTTSDFRTVDKFGANATYLTGSVGAVYGIPIVVSEFLDNVGTTGNHLGVLLYKPGFLIAERRGIELESEYEARQQVTAMYMSTRFDFKALTTNSSAALDSSRYAFATTIVAG